MAAKMFGLLFWGGVVVSGCSGATDMASTGAVGDVAGTAADSSSPGSARAGVGGSRTSSGGSAGTPAPSTAAASGGAAALSGATPAGRSGGSAGVAAASGNAGALASGSGGALSTAAGSGGTAGSGGSSASAAPTEKFSFFVTSLEAMRRLSKNENGFGGDLRYGEATGLAGADKICTEIAESAMPGAGKKVWHAFLSAKSAGAGNSVVHAKDRIGTGPWYDRSGRVIAMDLSALLNTRPSGADPTIADNLPNEQGEPNRPSSDIDNHDTITGSTATGEYAGSSTCEDYTSTTSPPAEGGAGGRNAGRRGPVVGHSWPAQSGQSWIQSHNAPGCMPSVGIGQMSGGGGDGVGSLGGYGGIYCFALSP